MRESGGPGRRLVSPALVGRGEELAQVAAAVSRPPAVAVIEGEAGIGKTRLVAELRTQLGKAGGRQLLTTGSCRQIREPFPLGPVIEAIRGLREHLTARRLSPLAGALRPLLPEFGDALPPPLPPLDDRPAERHRVFRALVEVLGSVDALVLVLEDLHWADEQTIDFIRYLLGEPPVWLSLVVTFRGEDAAATVRALTAKPPAAVTRSHHQLALLDERQTGALAGAILGTPRVSTDFAAYLHRWTSGLPFAVEEVLALLRARGELAHRGGWARRALQRLDVPTGIRDPILERAAGLSPGARTVVEAAAVLHTAMPADVLVATSPNPAPHALDEAVEAGLLAEFPDGDTPRIGFRHPLAAQAVYDHMPWTRRRRLHDRAAAALSTVEPPPLGQLAHHLRHAGQVAEWVVAAERAADHAIALGHDDEAVLLLEEALRHAALTADQRGRLAVKLARTAVEALHARDVRDVLLAVPTKDLPERIRGELRFWLALLLEQSGDDPRRAHGLLAQAIGELTERPDLRAWAMVFLGTPSGGPQTSLDTHLRWLYRSLELLPELADPAQETLILGKVAMVLTTVGDPKWRKLTEQMSELTGGTPRRRREVNAYDSVGTGAGYAGHHSEARDLLTAAVEGAVATGMHRLELRARSDLALLDYSTGRWDGLGERADLLAEELYDYQAGRVGVDVVAGCLAFARGELALAAERLRAVIAWIRDTGEFDLLPLPVAASLRLAVARDEAGSALAAARPALASVESAGVWPSAARILPPLVAAMVAAGQMDEARTVVACWARPLRAREVPLAAAVLPHAYGILAGQADLFLEAAGHYERLECPYEAAQVREQAAVHLLATERQAADQPLQEALAAYRRLGATWDTRRASGIARRHQVRLPAPYTGGTRGYGDALSPREREVAHLAAAGRTNEEIARSLFLSPKTVEKHVGSALHKLGLTTRRALAGRLAMTDDGQQRTRILGDFPP
ncbi:DNA-binding CsgD family transcriptional regulator [Kibdelosporangium banguiense]|uniref:DNA-binding CsgD family transcriptional regulator n=1 Tax=Kibdelosporangium banguiense TaxID=1365924 RepID=A0ABS4TU59_9PSEU|nr:LuxR family transcriptional regulator [Kibdelosporangium banguiense]MBP2327500.1 DNA-binding CsgD family transcriptional regulator [Kibdelosporangium banguiense]